MTALSVQKQPLALTDLAECPSFGEPIGPLPKQSYNQFFDDGQGTTMGTWECEPGKLKLDLGVMEFCHLIKGIWTLTDDKGEVTVLKAGDSFAFPRGWKGTSEVTETVRKVYTIIE
ncbi:DUF861 domain-containing protein [Pseudomaricurvus alkylphenolicus]|uniref:cupin domain-containing protein n=1 Tax=Pseudomaricurvus alkylphenolicus TaxID=1306991 RepID=UPI0014219381|nr:cupin domain-containing protein [Pseudomaricurvus alkylphenolicus]NIB42193.1 DUF861 domain-containing protein [Pseudomaricurvus alkylphenolicus]